MKEVVAAALLWLGQNTAYEIPETRPEVVVEPHLVIQNLQGVAQTDFYGLYDPRDNRIWLSEQVDLDTTAGQAKLVHELVHWLQDEAGFKQYACFGETEFEAYALQERFEKEHGMDSSVKWLWVMGEYSCPPPFAPDHTRPAGY